MIIANQNIMNLQSMPYNNIYRKQVEVIKLLLDIMRNKKIVNDIK